MEINEAIESSLEFISEFDGTQWYGQSKAQTAPEIEVVGQQQSSTDSIWGIVDR
jgi:hypothetical protein